MTASTFSELSLRTFLFRFHKRTNERIYWWPDERMNDWEWLSKLVGRHFVLFSRYRNSFPNFPSNKRIKTKTYTKIVLINFCCSCWNFAFFFCMRVSVCRSFVRLFCILYFVRLSNFEISNNRKILVYVFQRSHRTARSGIKHGNCENKFMKLHIVKITEKN